MSLFGAVRLYLLARQAPARHREPEELPPIVVGRWAAWAHGEQALAHTTSADDHWLTDDPCRLPDGSIGRVAVVLQGSEWALVCQGRVNPAARPRA